jgi:hypothetical protein
MLKVGLSKRALETLQNVFREYELVCTTQPGPDELSRNPRLDKKT